MARKPSAIVLDSWAIMSYLGNEPSAERVADIMADANEEGPSFYDRRQSGEVWYILAREVSVAEADSSIRQLRQLGIKFIDADWDLAHEAVGFKSQHKMSFADCFAAALAKQKKAHLITGDKEFNQVKADISITWL